MTRMSQKTLDSLVTQDSKDLDKEITKVSPDTKARNKKELEHLKSLYPLLDIKHEWTERGDLKLIIHTGQNSSLHTGITEGRCNTPTHDLDRYHLILSQEKQLMSLYPDLQIGIFQSRNYIDVSCWVLRDGSGHEAIGSIDILDTELHQTLSHWQIEAKASKLPNWFFCSGHKRAEPITSYGYFHFAGNYCNEWGDQHQEDRAAAQRETYE